MDSSHAFKQCRKTSINNWWISIEDSSMCDCFKLVKIQILFQCSNFRVCTFLIHKDKDAQDVFTSLVHLSRPSKVEDLYCFQYRLFESFNVVSDIVFRSKSSLPQQTGWNFFDLVAEFARQGVPNSSWVTCGLNQDWRICPTYPDTLMVPASASTSSVFGSAKFRSKGRLPALTFYHDKTGAALVRCSQPMSGLKGFVST